MLLYLSQYDNLVDGLEWYWILGKLYSIRVVSFCTLFCVFSERVTLYKVISVMSLREERSVLLLPFSHLMFFK